MRFIPFNESGGWAYEKVIDNRLSWWQYCQLIKVYLPWCKLLSTLGFADAMQLSLLNGSSEISLLSSVKYNAIISTYKWVFFIFMLLSLFSNFWHCLKIFVFATQALFTSIKKMNTTCESALPPKTRLSLLLFHNKTIQCEKTMKIKFSTNWR